MLYVNMQDFLKLGQKNEAFVLCKGYVFKLGYHKQIQQGCVAMNADVRKYLRVSKVDTVTLSKFVKPRDQVVDLSSISFQIALRQKVREEIIVNEDKLEELIKKSLSGQYFKSNQIVFIDYEGTLLQLTVTKTLLVHLGMAGS